MQFLLNSTFVNCGYDDALQGSAWEGGIRVPTAIHWPNGITGYRNSTVPASLYDVLPTIMEIVDIEYPKPNWYKLLLVKLAL